MDAKQLQTTSIPEVATRLIECILEGERNKIAYYRMVADDLYNADGNPNFLLHFKRPSIEFLRARMEEKQLMKVLYLVVSDFCRSINVAQNMNEDQVLEACYWLLTDSRSFWIEDYILMFDLVKKGKLVKIYNRIDRFVISEIREAYWQLRHDTMHQRYLDWYNKVSPEGRDSDYSRSDERKMDSGLNKLSGIINDMKNKMK